jgi:hypothetical protein
VAVPPPSEHDAAIVPDDAVKLTVLPLARVWAVPASLSLTVAVQLVLVFGFTGSGEHTTDRTWDVLFVPVMLVVSVLVA